MITIQRKIFLKNLEVLASISIHDFELANRQRILINLELYCSGKYSEVDDIDTVLDYDNIRLELMHLVEERHFNLQEKLCHEIARLCLRQPGIRRVIVSTRKPDVYPDCTSVGYELEATED